MPFVFIGSSAAGQTAVTDSPVYGKVLLPEEQRQGILVAKPSAGDPLALEHFSFVPLDAHIGWIEPHPCNGMLYAAGGGKLRAMHLAPDGSLTQVSAAATVGNTAHLELSADGAWALVANYSAGTVAVLPIRPDGGVGAATDSKQHLVKLNPALADRQEWCHPHHVKLDPRGNNWALVCDLGADYVFVYAFDKGRGALVGAADSDRHLKLPEGSGPRHSAFHPNGKWVYVLCELDGFVRTCSWDGLDGRLAVAGETYVLPDELKPCRAHHSGNAHVLVGKGGARVYVSTRTDGAIVTLSVDPQTGALTKLQTVSCGGVCPRNFCLDYATGFGCLRVGNQDSQNIVSFALTESGELQEPPSVLSIAGVCPNMLTAQVPTPEWRA